ncbi:MAG: SDR family NAD(P)-dependent oxidoreductase [Treponema sp.]|nr:SDR family NAD(P)-dependent oxidoreductase [Treponema sp.]
MEQYIDNSHGVFEGKRALVVGGTGGIGKAVAMDLAKRGASLIIHGGTSQERLDSTLKAIRENGGTAGGFLFQIKCVQDALEILEAAPEPDILVCAWGPFRRGSLETLDPEFWQTMIDGNLVIPGVLVSAVLPAMLKKNWGRILLFGGTNTDTVKGYTTSAAYSTAKTGLGVIAKSVAKSVAKSADVYDGGITCNVICPGLTDTEYLDEAALQYNRVKSPGGRALTPAAISRVCMEVLENSALNGAVIPVDSGICI